ncbi:MAG: hypothetical protein LQ345_005898 [Seirophora villosa]|nr:MAG: hypothetical protein LQ345_005898 [Seirophora villosa]
MAAVALSPAQYHLHVMSNRRAPLTSVPNAVNSPYRVPAPATKRSRQQPDQEDVGYDQPPVAKRVATANGRLCPRTPPQKQALQHAEARVFGKRPGNPQPTAFERRLLEAKEKKALEVHEAKQEQRVERPTRVAVEPLQGIRQWQKHYRKVFPTFVFYFESVSDETRARYSKFIRLFGAREEKFFSKEVTHMVTSRSLPGESDGKISTDNVVPPSTNSSSQNPAQPRTINPSLLDRNIESQPQLPDAQVKPKFDFDTAIGRKVHAANIRELETKKTVDILQRARDLGIKIWTLEKLERIAKTMLDNRADEPSLRGPGGRGVALNAPLPLKSKQEPDLSHLLRKEQLNGPSDAASTTSGTIPFKGPYIYIRCMDEKTKPILVKEWPRVANREDGEWPQFRGNGAGKCPFIVDQRPQRHEVERPRARVKQLQAQEVELRRQTLRAHTAAVTAASTTRRPGEPVLRKQPLAESREGGNVTISSKTHATGQENVRPSIDGFEKPPTPMKAPDNIPPAARLRFFNGEPAASGMQPSNITSAIRSQMISSTAAQPGAKAGTSKEVYGLKRKVLERNTAPGLQATQATQATQASERSIESFGAARAERQIPLARQTRRQAQERLVHIDEESTQSEDDEEVWRHEGVQKRQLLEKQASKREAKPGYCENCRDKYSDFETHVLDRKHRKFALTQENWQELDKLLAVLGRPIKEDFSDSF